MNAKRQTVWLVSMLSLMVVLSAYYLFTDNTDRFELGDEAYEDGLTVDLRELGGGLGTEGPTDAEVLRNTQGTISGEDLFLAMKLQRNEDIGKRMEELMDLVMDTNLTTQEEAQRAMEELNRLTDLDYRITHVEEVLTGQFRNAIVSEEGSGYRVLVQTDKLERSQAVSIIDLVIEELGIRQDQISVHLIQ